MSIATFTSEAQAGLINGGFELPDLGTSPTVALLPPANVPGWKTTDTAIEIWVNGFNGVPAGQGKQFAEINAFINGTLFQDVSGVAAGSQVGFTFLHRARVGTDVMALTITDLGIDNLFGGGDDTVLFNKQYSADTSAWVQNTNAGEAPIIALGNNIRFGYSAISTGSGDPGIGNFLDAADFGVGVGAKVPEPSSVLGLGLVTLVGLGTSFKRKSGKK
ncbi:PEP-CTERM sorting domain-containing protein [Microcystis aeruginosa BLCCF158]|uniref:PEP-CTERM sorting domain-containing protein n=1 Tax=Microcystis aeruginosa BLCC-F158 TaxID=2755316 RepID=A0A841UYM3_MICAE|nr:PEP-CTERM sorting domain-containing protein [Microcystis aeruginosa]MBC1196223.1 PEP-CTERM sorting domain-containing protein [Microcystis aeruginosa BLCC-F158]